MTLLKDFYSIQDTQKINDDHYEVLIHLNKSHSIFNGHFPNNPVTPGVCMMQIIKESTENILNKKLQLTKLSNVKFMAIINPEKNAELQLKLTISELDDAIKVRNTTHFEETLALKFIGEYKIL